MQRGCQGEPPGGARRDIALSRLESGGQAGGGGDVSVLIRRHSLMNTCAHPESPGGPILNKAGSPAAWQKRFAFLEER